MIIKSVNNRKILLFLSVLLLIPTLTFSECRIVGLESPYFSIKSGNEKVLTLDSIKGKVAVILYNSKDDLDANKSLSDVLREYHDKQPDGKKEDLIRIPVINTSRVFWLFSSMWRKKLIKISEQIGVTAYGDWDGSLRKSFELNESVPNVVVIDKEGIIRYAGKGDIKFKEIDNVKKLIESII